MTVDSEASAAGSPEPASVIPESCESIRLESLRDDITRLSESVSAIGLKADSHSRTRLWLKVSLALLVSVILARILQLSFADVIVIEPVSVPKSLADAGYTPEFVAARLGSAMKDVYHAAQTAKSFPTLASPSRDALDSIEVPQTKVSLRAFIDLVRYLTGIRPTTVQGMIVQEGTSLRLAIQVQRRAGEAPETGVFTSPDNGVDLLLAKAAHFALRSLDPYIEARYLVTNGRSDEAVILARQAIHSYACDNRCRSMMYNLWGNVMADRHQDGAAIEKFRQAIACDPHNRLAQFSWITVLEGRGDFGLALERIQLVLDRVPDDAPAHAQLAEIYLNQGNLDAAEAEYGRAARLDASDPRIETSLAVVCYRKKKFVEGAEHFRNALAMDPGDAKLYLLWGQELFNIDDYAGAMAFAKSAQSLAPQSPEVYILQADVAIQPLLALDPPASANDRDRAVSVLQRLTASAGENSDAFVEIGIVNTALGHQTEASAAFQKATVLCPSCANAWCWWAFDLVQHHHETEGDVAYDRAVGVAPARAATYFLWGRSLEQRGRLSDALAKYQKLVELNPRFPDASTAIQRVKAGLAHSNSHSPNAPSGGAIRAP